MIMGHQRTSLSHASENKTEMVRHTAPPQSTWLPQDLLSGSQGPRRLQELGRGKTGGLALVKRFKSGPWGWPVMPCPEDSAAEKSRQSGLMAFSRLALLCPSPDDPVPTGQVFRHLLSHNKLGGSLLGHIQWVGLGSLQARGGSPHSTLRPHVQPSSPASGACAERFIPQVGEWRSPMGEVETDTGGPQ